MARKICLAFFVCLYLCIMSVATQPPAQSPLSLTDPEKARIVADLASKDELAQVLARQHRPTEAVAILRDSLNVRLTVLGLPVDDEAILTTKNNLAAQLNHAGTCDEAEAMHREVLETNIRAHGRDDPENIVFLSNLAAVLNRGDRSRKHEVIPLLKQALELAEKAYGSDALCERRLLTKSNLANELADAGDLEQAEAMLRQTVQDLEKLLDQGITGEWPVDYAKHRLRAMTSLARVLSRMDRTDEALELLEKVLRNEKDPMGRGETFMLHGRVLKKLDKPDEAEASFRQSLIFLVSYRPHADEERIEEVVELLKDVLHKQGKAEEAEAFRVEGLMKCE